MKNVVALPAPKPRYKYAKYFAMIYAFIITVMVALQLFAFEDFIPIINDYVLPSGLTTPAFVAAVIVAVEVFALPFLLRMSLSPLMRWFSLVCSVAVASAWVKLSLWALWNNNLLENSGMLGSKIAIPAGWLAVVLSFGLLVLACVCVWGMWPHVRKN